MKRWLIFILIMYSIYLGTNVARADSWETAAYALQIADTASTMYALNSDRAVEANPLLGEDPSDALLLGIGAVQLGIIYWVNETWNPVDAHKFNVIFSTLKFGAVANNIYVIWEYDL